VSQPISSLQDPKSFAPPPKNVKYYGGPNTGSPTSTSFGPSTEHSATTGPPAIPSRQQVHQKEAEDKPEPPKGPYRVDTTGLSTNHLPKPPVRRLDQSGYPTPPATSQAKAKPSLPPRLPPRQPSPAQSFSNKAPESPPPPYAQATEGEGRDPTVLNQEAINRLGAAGISVPGLGIGALSGDTSNSSTTNPILKPQESSPQLSELQSRFAALKSTTNTSSSPKKPPLPPKRVGLDRFTSNATNRNNSSSPPPPVPFNTKPR
jgi:hypothetical protein